VAQTKSKPKARSKSKSKPSKATAKSKARAKSKASAKAKTNGAPTAKKAAGNGSSANGSVASGFPELARKAKVPLVASGAALVGVAGAIAATRSHKSNGHKVLGISLPKGDGIKPDAKKVSDAVVGAAQRTERFAQGVSRVASSVRDVGETANKVAKNS
jgi:hypothetical protein